MPHYRSIGSVIKSVELTDTLSTSVAAEMLNVSVATISKLADRKAIPCTRRVIEKEPGERIFLVSDVVAFAKSRMWLLNQNVYKETASV